MTQQSELFAQLRGHLHRGGAYWYLWTSEGKRSSWAAIGKDAPQIAGAKNLYFGVHPCAKKKGAGERSTLEDVAALNCLFAEFDAKDFDDSKTKARAHLDGIAPAPSVVVDSGGGFHAYWLLAEPFTLATKADRDRAKKIQANWVAYAGGDNSAKDIARVLRVPGSTNQKEKYAPNFPSVAIIQADFKKLYTLAQLEGIAVVVEAPRKTLPQTAKAVASANGHGAYIEKAIKNELAILGGAHEGERNHQLNKSANALGQLIHAGASRTELETLLTSQAIALGLPEREAQRTVKSGLDAGEKNPRIIPEGERAQAAKAVDVATKKTGFNLTEFGNAERLVAKHGANFRYLYSWSKWLRWDGKRWTVDDAGAIVRAAKETTRGLYAQAAQIEDDAARKALVDFARSSERAQKIAAMIKLAESEAGIGITLADLDADAWLFNCANGTVDLRTGELRPHAREDLLTKLAPAEYHADATSETWARFLRDTTGNDATLSTFLQTAAGYSLTGSTREEKLFFVHGPAAAGKSTFIEALKATLGDYATTSDFETFLARSMVGGARNDIARLAGARLVASIEVDQGKRLAEGLVKTITGGDTVAARFLYGETFEYTPQFKLWLVANHAPEVRDDDDAIWRRILRIPFTHAVAKADRDPKIKEELKDTATSGAAILAWAVEGAKAWQAFGLAVPQIVEDATDAYREDMDILKDFFADVCIFGEGKIAKAADLRKAYETWADANGEKFRISPRDFAERLRARGCEQDRSGGARLWRGIGIVETSKIGE